MDDRSIKGGHFFIIFAIVLKENFIKLNYKQYGTSGRHIIILHGLFGTLDNWQTISRELGDRYIVTAFDLRNHGRSPHSDEFSVSVMASDVYEMMQELRIPSAVIIGHSMGGKVAMVFSMAYPAVTDGMVSIDMAPKQYMRGHDDIFEALERVDLNVGSRKEVDDLLAQGIADYGTRQFLMKNLSRRYDGNGFEWKMNLPVIKANYEDIIDPIDTYNVYEGPALFIRGGKSNYILDEDKIHIKKLFPYAEFLTIEGAGHWVHADKPQETYNAIAEFADEL
ncbi:MAG: alpha/beta fold hydrolase [Bacteroidetes bacterium]|nr:alpha/beta fold hydrolase [Bacteroidota bacterium]MCO5277646.1 alpha/beta fold hydrolase [Saprospiraceae bacterium]